MPIAKVSGCGSYLPEKIVTNDDLSKTIDTNDQWIRERTGIGQRHIAAKGEMTSDLAANAAKQAMKDADIAPENIDLIMVATTTPDKTFPSTAAYVQAKIGNTTAAAMDLQAVCSGFVYGLHLADALIQAGSHKNILLIGAEVMSRVLDWEDRGTCILFGDGAGAFVIQATEGSKDTDSAILHSQIHCDGSFTDILTTNGGTSFNQQAGTIFMEGGEVFRHAVSKMSTASKQAMDAAGLTSDDIDWVVPHQANQRILLSCAKKLGATEDKLISTVEHHANTSSASIPLAIDAAYRAGKIKDKNILLLPALGAGLTWGSCIIRW